MKKNLSLLFFLLGLIVYSQSTIFGGISGLAFRKNNVKAQILATDTLQDRLMNYHLINQGPTGAFFKKVNVSLSQPSIFFVSKFKSIFIGIDAGSLLSVLDSNNDNEILRNLIDSEQTILFEEFISPKIQGIALEILESDIPASLSDFYFKIKAEELICLTLKELLKRGHCKSVCAQ